MSLAGRVIVAGMLAGLLSACTTMEIRDTRVVTGQIKDESGQPVANTRVVIVGRSLEYSASRLKYEERARQEIRTDTDTQGQYRIEFIPAKLGNNFYLFFYDQTGFDLVKYRKREPLDITPLLAGDRTVTVNQALQTQATWAEVERQIAFYGPDSDRGKVLRRFGLPEKRETLTIGEEAFDVWWYYTIGAGHFFAGDTLRRTHTFSPIREATPEQ